MTPSPLRVHAPAGPPPAPVLLQCFLRGLEDRPAPGRLPALGPAAARAVQALARGLPPGLEEAEAAGRLAGEVLRAVGEDCLRAVAAALAAGRAMIRPRWEPGAGELWWGGVLAKCFRCDAANQGAVLDAFEAQGWPAFVADPLERFAGLDGKVRLRETVRGLNHRLAAGTIRFHSGGPADGVRWAAVV